MAKSLQEIQDMLTDRWSNNACRGYVIKAMPMLFFWIASWIREKSPGYP
ncbi:hypothetical protein [Flintibacter muris]|nr:hypothetical protein [Flintibacter muris]